jgi:chemotaxis signal transduction protein
MFRRLAQAPAPLAGRVVSRGQTGKSVNNKKVWRKGIPVDPSVAPLVARMERVDEYRESLLRLHGMWDLLALLSQLSGTAAEIAQTRDGFHALTETLLDSLARQQLRQCVHGLRGKAQVAIDILVRNLFERTADVGFLATDAQVCRYVAAAYAGTATAEARHALEERFAAYVAKYSVYDDIVVLDPEGRVLARLDGSVTVERSSDALVAAALRPGVPYVETHARCDFLGGRIGLVYAAAIAGLDGTPAGVLCLSFRLDDELTGVFGRLIEADDSTLIALVDARGQVIASADAWQLPCGVKLAASADGHALQRIAGREYVSVAAEPTGYQGYAGPGWRAVALVPADLAFRQEDHPDDAEQAALARSLDTRDIFDNELRTIPRQALQIQRELARSVWNGKLRSGRDGGAMVAPAFASALLKEVGNTGERLRAVFDDAIAKLHTAAIRAVLRDARFQASLAIDIMDRNLYERANDCRWWALTRRLQDALAGSDAEALARASAVLQHINGLYTVYSLLVLHDAQGRIVAVSDPQRAELIGQTLAAETVRATLSLGDPQHYHVSPHGPSALAGGAPTCVYHAAIRPAGGGAPLGGIAIVFDGPPQFAAMLNDALPHGADGKPLAGAAGLFVTRDGRIVSSTDPRFEVGTPAPLPVALLREAAAGRSSQHVVEIDGVLHAAGISMSGGYREYRCDGNASTEDVAAVVLLRLGRRLVEETHLPARFEPKPAPAGDDHGTVEIATFVAQGMWFGLLAEEVIEALGQGRIAPVPQAAPWLPGLLRHADGMVLVVDLAALLQRRAATAHDGPLLLCRDGQGRRIALHVEALGEVVQAPRASLQPWSGRREQPPMRLLSGRSGNADALLTMLTMDGLLPSLGSDAPPRAVDEPMPA